MRQTLPTLLRIVKREAMFSTSDTGETDMTVAGYFRHARGLGFGAADCLRLARGAWALDEASRLRKLPTPGAAHIERDGSGLPTMLSFSIKVF